MTKEQTKAYIALARRLNKAAEFADKHNIELGNGGQVGSIIGSLADELAVMAGYHVESKQ